MSEHAEGDCWDESLRRAQVLARRQGRSSAWGKPHHAVAHGTPRRIPGSDPPVAGPRRVAPRYGRAVAGCARSGESDSAGVRRTTELLTPPTRNWTEGTAVTVKTDTSTDAEAPAAVLEPGVDQLDVDVEVAAATSPSPLVRLDSTSRDLDAFQQGVEAWAQSAVTALETTTDDARRIAVRDEAVRVAALATAAGAGVAVAIANEVLQRAVRSIGKSSPRRRAGRPRSAVSDAAAPDPVRGDATPASAAEGSQRRPHVGKKPFAARNDFGRRPHTGRRRGGAASGGRRHAPHRRREPRGARGFALTMEIVRRARRFRSAARGPRRPRPGTCRGRRAAPTARTPNRSPTPASSASAPACVGRLRPTRQGGTSWIEVWSGQPARWRLPVAIRATCRWPRRRSSR